MLSLRPTKTDNVLEALRNNELDLIEHINQLEEHFKGREPQVLSFIPEEGRFDRLRREAESLADKYPQPGDRPELFGMVIGVKDIFHVEGFQTRAGSQIPPEVLQGNEAECVTRLKEAGALIMGKTVTTEFAYFSPGPTRNPHNLEHTPGGSSSGSASAVGAELVPLALGTQTIGSITRPASFCGVIGYKPSFDRISKEGVIPLSQSLDHVGFFTNDLETAHNGAKCLVDDWKEQETLKEKPVFGVPEGLYLEKTSSETLHHFRETLKRIQNTGYEVKSIRAMPDFEDIVERHNLIVAVEAAQNHKVWFEKYKEKYHPKTAALINHGKEIRSDMLTTALIGREILRDHLSSLMSAEGIDLWLSPSAVGAAPKGLDSTGDPIMNLPWTHSGLPTLNIPSGKNPAGLPLGLQVAAGWYEDEKLFAYSQYILAALREENS